MQHFNKIFSLLILIILISCTLGEHPQENDAEGEQTLIHHLSQGKANLLIAHGRSHDFSLLSLPSSDSAIQNSLQVSKELIEQGRYCEAANAIVERDGLLYILCSFSHEIYVIEKKDLSLKRVISLGSNLAPQDLAISANGEKGFVTANLTNEVLIVDLSLDQRSQRILKRIKIPSNALKADEGKKNAPRPQKVYLYDDKLFVSLSNLDENYFSAGPGYIAIINTQTEALETIFPTQGRNTTGLYHFSTIPDTLYIINTGTYKAPDGSIDEYSLSEEKIKYSTALHGAPLNMALSDNNMAFITNGQAETILRYHTALKKELPELDLNQIKCLLDPEKKFKFISSITVYKDLLYALGFNQNCLMSFNVHSMKLLKSYQTGDGPELLYILKQ